jgi:hypothetical protein
VGTGIGLAMRLAAREPDPPDWHSPDRGQGLGDKTIATED